MSNLCWVFISLLQRLLIQISRIFASVDTFSQRKNIRTGNQLGESRRTSERARGRWQQQWRQTNCQRLLRICLYALPTLTAKCKVDSSVRTNCHLEKHRHDELTSPSCLIFTLIKSYQRGINTYLNNEKFTK